MGMGSIVETRSAIPTGAVLGDAPPAVGDRLLPHSQVGRGDLRDSEGCKQVPDGGSKPTAPQPVPPPQVLLQNSYEDLELEGLGMWPCD